VIREPKSALYSKVRNILSHNEIAINVANSINYTDQVLQGDPLNSLLLKVITAVIQTVMNSKGFGMLYMYADGVLVGART
jgi:hypothetical protein